MSLPAKHREAEAFVDSYAETLGHKVDVLQKEVSVIHAVIARMDERIAGTKDSLSGLVHDVRELRKDHKALLWAGIGCCAFILGALAVVHEDSAARDERLMEKVSELSIAVARLSEVDRGK